MPDKTWYLWVRGLINTHYDIGDDQGNEIGGLNRHGLRGLHATATDADDRKIDLRLDPNPGEIVAKDDELPIGHAIDGHLQLANRWFEWHMPRDGTATAQIRHDDRVLLAFAPDPGKPFARLDIAEDLPDPFVAAMMVSLIVVYDDVQINTRPGDARLAI